MMAYAGLTAGRRTSSKKFRSGDNSLLGQAILPRVHSDAGNESSSEIDNFELFISFYTTVARHSYVYKGTFSW